MELTGRQLISLIRVWKAREPGHPPVGVVDPASISYLEHGAWIRRIVTEEGAVVTEYLITDKGQKFLAALMAESEDDLETTDEESETWGRSVDSPLEPFRRGDLVQVRNFDPPNPDPRGYVSQEKEERTDGLVGICLYFGGRWGPIPYPPRVLINGHTKWPGPWECGSMPT
jgi:hypothetical protein